MAGSLAQSGLAPELIRLVSDAVFKSDESGYGVVSMRATCASWRTAGAARAGAVQVRVDQRIARRRVGRHEAVGAAAVGAVRERRDRDEAARADLLGRVREDLRVGVCDVAVQRGTDRAGADCGGRRAREDVLRGGLRDGGAVAEAALGGGGEEGREKIKHCRRRTRWSAASTAES